MKLIEYFRGKDLSVSEIFGETVQGIVNSLKQVVEERDPKIAVSDIREFLAAHPIETYPNEAIVIFKSLQQFARLKETTEASITKVINALQLKLIQPADKEIEEYLFFGFFDAQVKAAKANGDKQKTLTLFEEMSPKERMIPWLDSGSKNASEAVVDYLVSCIQERGTEGASKKRQMNCETVITALAFPQSKLEERCKSNRFFVFQKLCSELDAKDRDELQKIVSSQFEIANVDQRDAFIQSCTQTKTDQLNEKTSYDFLTAVAKSFVFAEETYEHGIDIFVALAKKHKWPYHYIHQLDLIDKKSPKPYQPIAPRVLYEIMVHSEKTDWAFFDGVVRWIDPEQVAARTLLLLMKNEQRKKEADEKFFQFANSKDETERAIATYVLAFGKGDVFADQLNSFEISKNKFLQQVAAKALVILEKTNPEDQRLQTFLALTDLNVRGAQVEYLFQSLKNSFAEKHDLAKAWLKEKSRAIVVFDVVERLLQEKFSPLLPEFSIDLIKNNWISDKFISLAKDNDEKKRQFATAVLAQWLSDNSLQIVDLLSIFQRLAKGNKNSRSVLQQVFTSVLETEQSYRVIEMFVRLHASLPEKQFKTVSTKLLENKRIPGALQQCAGDKSRYKAAEDFFLLLWRNEETETLANKYFEPFVSKDLKEPKEMAVRVLMRRIQKTDDPARLGLNRANASLSRSVVEALIRSMNEDGLGDASYFLFQCSLSDNPNIRSIYVQTLYLGMKNSADWARTQLNALSTLNDESLDLAKLIWNLIIKDEAIRQYAVDKAFEALQDV
ncbi:MAG: hypothetical protein KKH06_02500, partial [Gammaproteobacteria bacterium]|nr:hypothetical protein [Gammaproteobacteria bacterium]